MELARILLAVDDINQTWVEVPPWEAMVLQAVWGSAVLRIETGPTVRLKKPSAHKEYARLNRRYGTDRDGNEYVAQTFGNAPLGVHALDKAIQDDGLLVSLRAMAEQTAVYQENPEAATTPAADSPSPPEAATTPAADPPSPPDAAAARAKTPAKKRSRAKTDPLL